MNSPRILILESIHEAGVERLSRNFIVEDAIGVARPEMLARVANVEAIVVKSVVQVDGDLFDHAPNLKVVGRAGVGVDNIDLNLAREKDIAVLTVPAGNAVSAAELAVMQILCLVKNAYQAQTAVNNEDYRRDRLIGRELAEMTVGIVGMGSVGGKVAERLRPFGCTLVGYDPLAPDSIFDATGTRRTATFDELIAQVDVVSFHVPLTDETKLMLDRESLSKARPGLFVVNTARGQVIDDDALLEALANDIVAGAALDVLDDEPPFYVEPGEHDYSHKLVGHPKIFVTPHMAASTVDCQRRIALDLAMQMERALL